MSPAIRIGPCPADVRGGPEDWMPFTTRLKVAKEINRLWAEFVTEMHDGPATGQEVADKFWKFVTTRG